MSAIYQGCLQVICDKCQEEKYFMARNRVEAEEGAKGDGWFVTCQHVYCPRHNEDLQS